MYAAAPAAAASFFSARARAGSHRLIEEWGLDDLNERLVGALGLTIQGGPFAGTRLPRLAMREHLGPYLLGTYESELHEWFAAVRADRFRTILDVGAKFGYYAVGLACAFPAAHVIAFDTDPWARRAVREMARANDVESRLAVRGFCRPSDLEACRRGPALLISDCEGFEAELFTKASLDALRATTLIIEVHDELAPGVGTLIRDRFRATHSVESTVSSDARASPVDLAFLPPSDAARALLELRPPQEWLFLRPRASRQQPTGQT
jgi:hypothetical protein